MLNQAVEDTKAQEKAPAERMAHAIKTIRTLYPHFRNPGQAKTTLSTLRLYLHNIASNPLEPKFHKIKKENKAFQDRVGKITGGTAFLKAAGFDEDEEFFSLNEINIEVLQQGINMLEEVILTLE